MTISATTAAGPNRPTVINSSDPLIAIPDAVWAKVRHGDWDVIHGEVLIADLFRLKDAAIPSHVPAGMRVWHLRQDRRGDWHASGPVTGVGTRWWSDAVTYRSEVRSWDAF